MSRQDVIDAVAEKAEMSKAQAGRALDAFFATVEEGLKKGQDITFVGFGKFSVKKRDAREGRNPATGETMKIPAKKVVTFKVGKKLKDSVQ